YSQAAVEFEAFYTRNPSSYLADSSLYMAGESSYLAKDYSRAEYYLNLFNSLFQNSKLAPKAYLILGKAYRAQNKIEPAVNQLMSIQQRYPLSSQAQEGFYLAFEQQASLLRTEDARGIAEAYRALYPTGTYYREIMYRMGRLLKREHRYQDAMKFLTDALKFGTADSIYTQSLFHKAEILAYWGQTDQALSDLTLAMSKNPGEVLEAEGLFLKGKLYARRHDRVQSAQYLGQYISRYPERIRTREALRILAGDRNLGGVKSALASQLNRDGVPSQVPLYYAYALQQENKSDSLLPALQRIKPGELDSLETALYHQLRIEGSIQTHQPLKAENILWDLIRSSDRKSAYRRQNQLLRFYLEQAYAPAVIRRTVEQFRSEGNSWLDPALLYELSRYMIKQKNYQDADRMLQIYLQSAPYHELVDSVINTRKLLGGIYLPEPIPPDYYALAQRFPALGSVLAAYYSKEFPQAITLIEGLDAAARQDRGVLELAARCHINAYMRGWNDIATLKSKLKELSSRNPGLAEWIDYQQLQLNPTIENYRLYVKSYPAGRHTSSVRLNYAQALSRNGSAQEAIREAGAVLSQATQGGQDTLRAMAYYILGGCYHRARNAEMALSNLNQYLKSGLEPGYQARAEFLMIDAYLAGNQPDTARELLRAFSRRWNIPAGAMVIPEVGIEQLARHAARTGELAQAVDLAGYLVNPYRYRLLMAQIAKERQDWESCRDYLSQIPEGDPLYPEALFLKAQTAERTGDRDQAIRWYQEYLDLSPSESQRSPQAGTQISGSRDESGMERVEARLALTGLAIASELLPLASGTLEALKSDPLSSRHAYQRDYLGLKLAILDGDLSKLDKSIQDLRKTYPSHRDSTWNLVIDLAEAFINQKNIGKASDLIERVLKEKDLPALCRDRALKDQAMVLFNQDKFPEAIDILNQLSLKVKDETLLAEVYFSLSTAYYYGKPQNLLGAIEYYEKVLNLGSVNPTILAETYFNLGTLYEENKQFNEAIPVYRQLIRDHPNYPRLKRAKFRIAYCYYNMFRYVEAILIYQQLMDEVEGEDAAEMHYYLGDCYFKNGEYREAVHQFLIVAYQYGEYPMFAVTSMYMAGEIYQRSGDQEQAILIYQRIVKKYGAESQYGKMAAQRLSEMVP
nr:tetratricopeptide repeat protein [Candidatus Delongbacteria bacterium]